MNDILTKNYAYLLQIANSFTRNRAHAHDLAQSVCVKVLENIEKFDGRNERAWLYIVTRNLYYAQWRKARTAVMRAHKVRGPDTVNPDAYASLELATIVARIPHMPTYYTELIPLLVAECSYDEIATALQINANTVKSRLSRMRAMLLSDDTLTNELEPGAFDTLLGLKKPGKSHLVRVKKAKK